MIRDTVDNLWRYEPVLPAIPKVKEFLKQNEFKDGKYDICEGCYALVQSFDTKSTDNLQYEVHRDYADIQLLIKGEERQFLNSLDNLKVTQEYEPDCALYAPSGINYLEEILLSVGDFVVYFPGEAHAPGYDREKCVSCQRVIIKIKM